MPEFKMPKFKIPDINKKEDKQTKQKKQKLKKIFNRDCAIIGYVKKDQVIDLNYRVVANILRDEKSNVCRLDFLNGLFGAMYNNGNIFDPYGNYIGSIEENKKSKLYLFLGIAMFALVAISFAFSGKFLELIGTDDTAYIINITQSDTDTNWSEIESLDILSDRIYPESSGVYSFKIDNKTNSDVKYDVLFESINEYDIPMKFKVRINNINALQTTDWVDISEINIEDVLLTKDSKSVFKLEWMWDSVSDEVDTLIASSGTATYTIKITVSVELD